MKIRKAKITDMGQINDLNERYFHEKGRDFEKYIKSKEYEIVVADEAGRVIGFTGFKYQNWNKSAEIIDIFVHPKFRKQGIGSKLIKALIGKAKEGDVRVLISEAPSRNPVFYLYKKLGFRKCGYNDRYYDNLGEEKAIFMSFDMK